VRSGVCAEKCSAMLKEFFKKLRQRDAAAKAAKAKGLEPEEP